MIFFIISLSEGGGRNGDIYRNLWWPRIKVQF